MFDWILEADVSRLTKAANEATDPRARSELRSLAARKLAFLSEHRSIATADATSDA